LRHPPNGIYAVVPQRKHLPLRVRLWIDFLRHHYGRHLLAGRAAGRARLERGRMSLEAGLAYAHLLAILSLIVFLSSEAALCRAEWMNEAVVRRLGRMDLIYGLSALAVLLTGLARIYLGMKGSAWYWGNPWLHAKLALLVVIGTLSIQPTRMFIRWRRALDAGEGLPPPQQVRRVRRLVMWQAHLLALVPLAAVLLARGFGFESPKVAAHGDFASTAAMQLAKPLKLNPRQLAETCARCCWPRRRLPALGGHRHRRPRLHQHPAQAAAKQQVVREVLSAGRLRPAAANGQRMLVEFVSANPTGPLHVGHGRQAALGDAICNLYATQGWDVYREFYYNDAGVQIETLANSTQLRAKGFKPGDAGWPEAAYNGDYIRTSPPTFWPARRSGGRPQLHRQRRCRRPGQHPPVRRGLPAPRAGPGPAGLSGEVRQLLPGVQPVHQRQGRRRSRRLQDAGKTYEQDGALWLRSTDYGDDKDRVMRKGDGSYTYFVPDVAYHITKWERGFTKVVNIQGTDHHGTIARVRAGLQAAGVGIPPATPTTCCTPWCG
jgi:uncharacterized membrane protein